MKKTQRVEVLPQVYAIEEFKKELLGLISALDRKWSLIKIPQT